MVSSPSSRNTIKVPTATKDVIVGDKLRDNASAPQNEKQSDKQEKEKKSFRENSSFLPISPFISPFRLVATEFPRNAGAGADDLLL